ncbi:MAG: PEP-CTERM sorting domain-containing protein [Pseudanabaenales cyanobacterium]|nr:PEP-CTERM sorting domain-containing protein [Pseudanabaenales cyanobacterium]
MRFKPLITATLSTMATATVLGILPSSASAFTLAKMSGSWDNVDLTNGLTVGSNGVAPNSNNFVEFLTVDDESQVRWGNPPGSDNSSGRKSGLGFTGESDIDIAVGQVFNIGKLRHFNNPIYTPLGTQVDFSLNMEFADIGLENQSFDFVFNIDETRNNQSVCPYATDAGKGCSDSITWEQSIASSNTFAFEGEEYALELVGFSSTPNSEMLLQQFISQEQETSEAYIFAQIAKVDKPNEDDPEKVPEPSAMVGVALLGTYFVSRRCKQQSVI